jgi:uncharacterized protein (DUF1501 family)
MKETAGCPEFHLQTSELNRRGFLKTVMALGGGIVLTGMEGLSVTTAAVGDPLADTIITIYMRGGMDGLMAVPVLGDATLASLRPNQRLNDSMNLNLDGHFGLHPKLATIKQLYDAGQAAVIQAVGTPVGTRSHFDDQKALEYAAYDNPGTTDGWQNRYLQALGTTDVFAGYSTGFQSPASFRGAASAMVFEDLNSVTVAKPSNYSSQAAYLKVLENLHSDGASNWQVAAQHSLVATQRLQGLRVSGTSAYPKTRNGSRFQVLAGMMKQGYGVKTANLEFNGDFDIHDNAGIADGAMADNFADLDACIKAFKDDIGTLWNNTTIITITEFGRRLQENASNGFDHGWASAMFVLGGGIRGGQVYTKWPGLTDTRDGDLKVTTDYRSVLAEVMRVRGGMSAGKIRDVLPSFSPVELGLAKPLA